jgi:MOSC domain-containing protein YiiM
MKVVAIHTASRSQGLVVAHTEIEAVAGKGLVGDRHFDHYSKGQITVVSNDELALAEADLGYPIAPGSTRRNVTVSGLQLPRTPGSRLRLGEVVVEVYRDASPCTTMEGSVGPGAQAALRGRAGVRGMIVEGGTLRVGDPVQLA